MSSTKTSSKIKYACVKEGIKFNMYRCRNQFSTNMIKNGKDIRTIMELMGHNNIKMIIDYTRSENKSKLNALKIRE